MATCTSCGRRAGFFSEVCDICRDKRLTPNQREAAGRQLSSRWLLREAVAQICRHRAALLLALVLPALFVLGIRLSQLAYVLSEEGSGDMLISILLSLVELPFYVMFATICHRTVLLGSDSLANRWGIFWSIRETKFLGWLLLLSVVYAAVWTPLYGGLYVIPAAHLATLDFHLSYGLMWMSTVLLIAAVPATYLNGRLGLVLPAAAVGNRFNPIRSWRSTAANGRAIFLALLILLLATKIIGRLLSYLLPDINVFIRAFLRDLLYFPLVAVGVVIITIAYRELVQSAEGDAATESGHQESD